MVHARRKPVLAGNELRALLDDWRADPTPDRSRMVCDALSRAERSPPPRIVAAIAAHVRRHCHQLPAVLVALGRLLLAAGDLRGAHDSLARAEGCSPRASEPLRVLADVLLALGDAERAVLALELARLRAAAPGDPMPCGDDLEGPLVRARALGELQRTEGEGAVAAEVDSAKSTHGSGVRRRPRTGDERAPEPHASTRVVRPSAELLDRLREADGVGVPTAQPAVERQKRRSPP